MKDLNTLLDEVLNELDTIGISINKANISIYSNPKFRKILGKCIKTNDDEVFKIEISKLMLDTQSEFTVKNIIAHELIHTIKNCFNHGEFFSSLMSILNKVYSYQDEACIEIDYNEQLIAHFKYCLRCPKCGKTYVFDRKTDKVKFPSEYGCEKCHSPVERIK